MFWKTTPKDGKPSDEKTKKSPKKAHHFHNNPEKSWRYYGVTAKSELNSLIKIDKFDTSSTADSSIWSASLEQMLKEQDEAMDVDDDNGQDEFFFTPEGITRVPFTNWAVDLLGTSKHSSYFQGNSYIAEADNNTYKLKAPRRFRFKNQAYSHTPSNSPLPSPVR